MELLITINETIVLAMGLNVTNHYTDSPSKGLSIYILFIEHVQIDKFCQNPDDVYIRRCLMLVMTRAVLVFATEHKNNVDPCLQSQKQVNYDQLVSCTYNCRV